MIKKLLTRGFIGVGTASVACCIVSVTAYICGADFSDFGIIDFVLNQLGYELIGLVTACASLLFEVKRFSRLEATVLHFCAILLAYMAAGFMAGWFRQWGISLLIPVACFIASYIITWCTVYFSLKHTVNAINRRLEENRNDTDSL